MEPSVLIMSRVWRQSARPWDRAVQGREDLCAPPPCRLFVPLSMLSRLACRFLAHSLSALATSGSSPCVGARALHKTYVAAALPLEQLRIFSKRMYTGSGCMLQKQGHTDLCILTCTALLYDYTPPRCMYMFRGHAYPHLCLGCECTVHFGLLYVFFRAMPE